MMAGFLLTGILLLAMAAHSSASWCICKDGISDAVLQKSLDYACGAGADCNPTHQNGPCFNPNTVRAHCSYAVNSYFQRNRQIPTACDFSGTAAIVTSDPSIAGCAFPSTASTSATPGTRTPTTSVTGTSTTGMPTTTTANGGSPLVTTPSSGALGGANGGLGPTGIDMSHGETLIPKSIPLCSISMMLVALVLSWG